MPSSTFSYTSADGAWIAAYQPFFAEGKEPTTEKRKALIKAFGGKCENCEFEVRVRTASGDVTIGASVTLTVIGPPFSGPVLALTT